MGGKTGVVVQEATAWDALVASALSRESTETSVSPSTARLRLRSQPAVEAIPRMARSIAKISNSLRTTIRGLVGGELNWPLFMHGTAGVGKTCAALCVLDYAGGDYWTTAKLTNAVIDVMHNRLTWRQDGRTGTYSLESFWRRQSKLPLVVLDEIGGRDRVTDHNYECVQRMLDERSCMPLICISNHDLTRITDLYDDRIASRLAAGTVIGVSGEDRRVSKR